jgi:hypothetical protein
MIVFLLYLFLNIKDSPPPNHVLFRTDCSNPAWSVLYQFCCGKNITEDNISHPGRQLNEEISDIKNEKPPFLTIFHSEKAKKNIIKSEIAISLTKFLLLLLHHFRIYHITTLKIALTV